MEIQKLHLDGVSVSEIARRLNMDRKTVREYLRQAPREQLGAALGHNVSHQSAHGPELELEQAIEPRLEIAPKHGYGMGLGR